MTITQLGFGGDRVFDHRRRTILAATQWTSNAELVEALHAIGHIPTVGRVLDPTYGRGAWWNSWRPTGLIGTDLRSGVDFRRLPFADNTFDAAVFDPPHIPSYSIKKSTAADFRSRYGIDVPRNDADIRDMYQDGIEELARVIRGGGTLVVKTTDYVNGRRYHPMAARVTLWAESFGFDVIDVLIMIRPPGPTSNNRKVATSRRNYSTASVFRRVKNH